ncbi:hypothetical protein HaLaN_27443, partial [Haematococcus lacustris]
AKEAAGQIHSRGLPGSEPAACKADCPAAGSHDAYLDHAGSVWRYTSAERRHYGVTLTLHVLLWETPPLASCGASCSAAGSERQTSHVITIAAIQPVQTGDGGHADMKLSSWLQVANMADEHTDYMLTAHHYAVSGLTPTTLLPAHTVCQHIHPTVLFLLIRVCKVFLWPHEFAHE